ncbi:glycosyltransferase [Paenibacillus sp. NPDC056722]|uniref:MGDG synthase family glycosyltransferase n=1 Tax=Paenibacillus sp. NPDC056722 TaxID=3345924 RepID=UPI0036B00AA1
MKINPVVLIVSSAFGDGHAKTAQALQQSFMARGVEQVYIVDLFAEVHPFLNAVSRTFYLKSTAYAPGLYGMLYDMTSRMKPGQPLSRFLHSMGKRKVEEVLKRLKPDVIIHTFPYLAASELSEKVGMQVPIFTVLTDYVLHGRWIHPSTWKYFAPSDSVKEALLASGVPPQAITVSGIPIREAFQKIPDRTELLRKHGLNASRRYILLSAGAYGVLGNVQRIIRTILEQSEFDVIVLCGNNHKLRLNLERRHQWNDRVHIQGYTDQIHELMSLSSGLLTKAGAITLTEAFSQSLPVIVYRPLPGQEKGNARSLSGQKAIYTAYNEKQLADYLHQLQIKSGQEEVELSMHALSRKESSQVIVSEVLDALEAAYDRQMVSEPH